MREAFKRKLLKYSQQQLFNSLTSNQMNVASEEDQYMQSKLKLSLVAIFLRKNLYSLNGRVCSQ